MAVDPLPHINCAGQTDIHLQPPCVSMGCGIGHGPSRRGNAGPEGFEKECERQVDLAPQPRVSIVERLDVDIFLGEGQ